MVDIAQGQAIKLNSSVDIEKIFGNYNKPETQDSYNMLKEAIDDGRIDENELVELKGSFSTAEIDELLKGGEVIDVKATGETEGADETGEAGEAGDVSDVGETGEAEGDTSNTKEKIANYKRQIAALEAEMTRAENDKKDAQTKLNTQKEVLKTQENDYNKNLEKLEQENDDLAAISRKIDAATEALEDDIKGQMKRATFKAMADFNPDEGQSWEDFLAGRLEGIGADGMSTNFISRLGLKAEDITSNIKTLSGKLNGLQSKIEGTQGAISQLVKTISTADGILAANPVKINELNQKIKELDPVYMLRGMVDDVELSLVEEHNIDLTEKLCDGSPRYLIASGAVDGKMHIYDMGDTTSSNENGTTYYKSLVRQFCSGGGFDVIECGNGWISKIGDSGDNLNSIPTAGGYSRASGSVFHVSECGELVSESACYSTASPLSFDINGDGVKTSNELVQFDIDGDGTVDTINDSADFVLMFDKDGDGLVGEDGSECFGDNTDLDGDGKADGYKNGFEALAALARKEGLINDSDDMQLDENDITMLQDKYNLSLAQGYNGERVSLTESGITEINLSNADTKLEKNFDNQGNDLMTQEGATFKVNGEEREYADIWHSKKDETGALAENTEFISLNKSETSFNPNELKANLNDRSTIENNFFQNEANLDEILKKAQETIEKYSN